MTPAEPRYPVSPTRGMFATFALRREVDLVRVSSALCLV